MTTIFEKDEREERQDSEVTLGTGTLLAIFFGLVVVCGVFFGFGYSMGRRSSDVKSAAAQSTTTPATVEAVQPETTRRKPSAFEVLPQAAERASSAPSGDAAARTAVSDAGTPSPAGTDYPARSAGRLMRNKPVTATAGARPAPRLTASPTASAPAFSLPVAQLAGPLVKPAAPVQSMVQIAAVSHQEDADALVAALKKHGYAVSVRNEPQDRLMHVQVGPFSSHADAVTMRQKLLSDGYNAIIK